MFIKNLNFLSAGGVGDFLLSYKLKHLLNYLYPDVYIIKNYYCSRKETFDIVKILFPKDEDIIQLPEDYLKDKRTEDDLGNVNNLATRSYILFPDKLFRGVGAPPLKQWGITNFLVKQWRTLLGKHKPENIISFHLNSVTNNYTYHSIPELVTKVAKEYPDKKIYYPLLIQWGNKEVPQPNFNNLPKNVELNYNPTFEKVYEMLCKSEYAICTDNLMMHLCHEIAIPHIVLDPQYNKIPWEARWRSMGFYHSVPISALPDDIIDTIRCQLEYSESQMIGIDKIFRKNINVSQELLFKE